MKHSPREDFELLLGRHGHLGLADETIRAIRNALPMDAPAEGTYMHRVIWTSWKCARCPWTAAEFHSDSDAYEAVRQHILNHQAAPLASQQPDSNEKVRQFDALVKALDEKQTLSKLMARAIELLRRWAFPDVNVPWTETKVFLAEIEVEHPTVAASPQPTQEPPVDVMRTLKEAFCANLRRVMTTKADGEYIALSDTALVDLTVQAAARMLDQFEQALSFPASRSATPTDKETK